MRHLFHAPCLAMPRCTRIRMMLHSHEYKGIGEVWTQSHHRVGGPSRQTGSNLDRKAFRFVHGAGLRCLHVFSTLDTRPGSTRRLSERHEWSGKLWSVVWTSMSDLVGLTQVRDTFGLVLAHPYPFREATSTRPAGGSALRLAQRVKGV